MSETREISIEVTETYKDIPIVQLSYREPTLLTAEVQREHALALLELPYPRFVLVMSFNNLSISSSFTHAEQAEFFRSEVYQSLSKRLVTLIRFHPGSLTSLVFTMSVYSATPGDCSNFVPDLGSAMRLARRSIDRQLVAQK